MNKAKKPSKTKGKSLKRQAKKKTYPKTRGKCLICIHEKRQQFETNWLSKKTSFRKIAKEVGCSPTLVFKHMHEHLITQEENMRNASDGSSLDVLAELGKLLKICDRHSKAAQESNDLVQVKSYIGEARQVLKVMSESQGRIQRMNIKANVFSSSQLSALTDKILKALDNFPKAKIEVAKALESFNKKS